MNKRIFIVMLLALQAVAAPKKKDDGNEGQLQALRISLESLRDSLQKEISERWRAKQQQVGQREADKEELARLRDSQERAYLDLSRAKEECFTRERNIGDAQRTLQEKRDSWLFMSSAVEEILGKEAEKVIEAFPLDRESRRLNLENLRREYNDSRNELASFCDLVAYKLENLEEGCRRSLTKQTVLPDDGEPQQLTVARFGHVFGYGMSPENTLYIIRQTGRMGSGRYVIERIGEPRLTQSLMISFPEWVEKNIPCGTVLVDVLQNAQSGSMISGEKTGAAARIREYISAGGPVMVPLLLLPVWALILVIIKLVQLGIKHRSCAGLSEYVVDSLDKGDTAGVRNALKKRRGAVARVVSTLLDHSEWDRDSAEKAVKGIIVEEIPSLNKHLNTLAVIAGVAPLLGLLGTVTGMINLFEVITNYGTGDPKIMAGGISEALITTQTGLTIAIPILLIHNYLRNRRDRIAAEMEKSAIQIMNRLWPGGRREA